MPTVDPIPFGYCHCGCGELTRIETRNNARRGRIKGMPNRFVNRHARRLSPVEYVTEDHGYKTPCWIWQRSKDRDGYGFRTNEDKASPTRGVRAHAWYYTQKFGPIPKGLLPDHLCRIPSCVNPDHIELVTPAENTRRGRSAKLTSKQVAYIKRWIAAGELQETLANQFGVSQTLISRIKRGLAWADI